MAIIWYHRYIKQCACDAFNKILKGFMEDLRIRNIPKKKMRFITRPWIR